MNAERKFRDSFDLQPDALVILSRGAPLDTNF